MSPLVGAPTLGYTDYQREDLWDSSSLYGLHRAVSSIPDSSPVINCARYASIAMYMSTSSNPIVNTLQWSADSAGSTPLGQLQFVTSPLITNPLQLMYPNLGPYVHLTRTATAAGAWGADGQLFATNRQHVNVTLPQSTVLINAQSQPLGAGTGVNLYPTDLYAGPVTVFTSCSFATGTLSLEYLDGSDTWNFANDIDITPGNKTAVQITPLAAWRYQLVNSSGAAGAYYVIVIPSQTGSS